MHSKLRLSGPGNQHEVADRTAISDERFGELIVEVLSRSRTGLSAEEFKDQVKPVFRVAGVASFNDLPKKWAYISIEEIKPDLVITPMRRCRNGGYDSYVDDPIFKSGVDGSVAYAVQNAIASMDHEIGDEDNSPGHV